MSHGGDDRSGSPRRDQPWWSDDAPSIDTGATDLPTWAARNLSDPGQDQILARTRGSRHRHGGTRGAARTPSRTRGWGLAVVALAAAAGAVPLAVSTLAQQDDPLPRVGTFPVASPGELPSHAEQGRRPEPTAPEREVFDEGVPAPGEAQAPVAVSPLARARPAVVPRPPAPTVTRLAPAPPRVTPARPVTPRSTPTTVGRSSSGDDDSTSTSSSGGGGRSGSGSGSDSGSGSSSGSDSGSGSDGGLVGGLGRTVGGVTGAVGQVLH